MRPRARTHKSHLLQPQDDAAEPSQGGPDDRVHLHLHLHHDDGGRRSRHAGALDHEAEVARHEGHDAEGQGHDGESHRGSALRLG